MCFLAGKKRTFLPAWIWILVFAYPVFILVRWLVWWLYCPSDQRTAAYVIDTHKADPIMLPSNRDDLSLLKGVGPKTADVFYQSGIFTFKQLGLYKSDQLNKILEKNSLPLSKAKHWQEQAKLAAAGEWEKLKKLG